MGLVFFDNNIVSDEQEKMANGQLSKLSYWVQNEPVVTLNIFTNFYFDTDFVWQFVGWWYFCILQFR